MPARNRLRDIANIPVTAIMLGTIASVLRQIGKPIHPYMVSTQRADFLLLMGVHGMGRVGQEAILPNDIGMIDAAFLETGSFTYLKQNRVEVEFPHKRFEETAFYRKLIPALREKKIPILFGDLPFSPLAGTIFAVIANATSTGAVVGGLSLAASGSDRSRYKRSVGTALALWGFSSLIKMLVSPDPDMVLRNKTYPGVRKAAFYSELSHPERILEIFRNALIAHKLLYYSEMFYKKEHRKPVIAVVMGSGHELISEYLTQGKVFCQKVLASYPDLILKLLLSGELKHYYPVLAELSYAHGAYTRHIIIDPGLDKQVSELR